MSDFSDWQPKDSGEPVVWNAAGCLLQGMRITATVLGALGLLLSPFLLFAPFGGIPGLIGGILIVLAVLLSGIFLVLDEIRERLSKKDG